MKRAIITLLSIFIVFSIATQIFRFFNYRQEAKKIIENIDNENIAKLKEMVCDNPKLVNARIPSIGDTILIYSIERRKIAAAKILLGCGANPNLKGLSERAAIHVAVENDMPEAVKILLKAGANIESKGYRHEDTPLHMAASRGFSDIGIILIEYGAKINSRNMQGETPLMYAVDKKRISMIQLLLKNGANMNLSDQRERTAKSIAAMRGIDLQKVLE